MCLSHDSHMTYDITHVTPIPNEASALKVTVIPTLALVFPVSPSTTEKTRESVGEVRSIADELKRKDKVKLNCEIDYTTTLLCVCVCRYCMCVYL